MTQPTFKPEPALRHRLPSFWRLPLVAGLARSACVCASLSLPYLVYLAHTHAH